MKMYQLEHGVCHSGEMQNGQNKCEVKKMDNNKFDELQNELLKLEAKIKELKQETPLLNKKSMVIGGILFFLFSILGIGAISTIVKPYNFLPETLIEPSHVNKNFDDLYTTVNAIVKEINSSNTNIVPVGTIVAFGGYTYNIPSSWVLCDGRELSRMQFKELFAIIGTTFGEGDGNTTFNLPDTRGLFLRGAGKHNKVV